MSDLKRVSFLAVVFLVLLRIAIGWQFLYEGYWKYDTMDSPNPWTAKGYLANAKGPYRDHFRDMVGDFPGGNDPYDLLWLDYDNVKKSWEDWAKRFTNHYDLTEEQKSKLDSLLNGPEDWSVNLKEMRISREVIPPPSDEDIKSWISEVKAKVTYENGVITVDGDTPLIPSEVDKLYSFVGAVVADRIENGQVKPTLAVRTADGTAELNDDDQPVRLPDGPEKLFAAGIFKLNQQIESGLGSLAKLRASLKGDPDRVGGIHRLQSRIR